MVQERFPSFAGLKAFYAVASTGTAVKAAERLGISASSISHQLKAFEKELGVRLLENRKGKLRLTAEGERYFEMIREPLSRIQKATEDIRSTPGRRIVSVTLTPSFASSWLMPRLQDLINQHPDVELNLITTTRVVDMVRENVDLAIRRGTEDWDGCVSERLIDEEIIPVMAPELRDTVGDCTLQEALAQTRAIVNTTLADEWDLWSAQRGIASPSPPQRFNLETYELTIQAARDGLGIALGRRPLVDALVDSGALVAPFYDAEWVGYFVIHRDEPLSSDVKRVRSWLLEQAR